MTTDPPTGFSFDALLLAKPGAMPSRGDNAPRHADPKEDGAREVQVFTFLARGLHEGLHREFDRVVV